MVQGFFYNSVGGDRKYNGNSVNESKRPFYKDGVFAGHLEVTADGEAVPVSVTCHGFSFPVRKGCRYNL